MLSKTEKMLVGLVVSVVFAVILLFTSVFSVKTGETAIISRFGKVNRISSAGLNFKIPFVESVYKIETREYLYYFTVDNKYGNTSISASTRDLQTITIELSVQASISDPEKVYEKFRSHHFSRFINPRVRAITQSAVSRYTIEEFITKRAELSQAIFEDLKDNFAEYGFVVSNVSIVNHDFSDEYEVAVEQKKVAEQAVERAKAEQEKLSIEAESKVKLAEYALKEKELQAQANKIESQTLTPEILQKMFLEKWDGHLPKVQGNGSNLFLPQDFLDQ